MNMRLRQATDEDIPRLKELLKLSVRGSGKDYYTKREIEMALVRIFGIDTQLISDRTYYVAEILDKIVGCGGWSKRKKLFGGDQFKATIEDSQLNPEPDAAIIRAFFVHPEYVRRGIGRAILNEYEIKAIEAGFEKVELLATLPGRPFYTALG